CVIRPCTNTAGGRNCQPRPTEAVSTGWRYLLGGPAEQHEFLRVAAVERQFDNARGFHDLTDADAASLDQTRVGLNFNLFGNLADLQDDPDSRIAVNLQHNAGLHECTEAS